MKKLLKDGYMLSRADRLAIENELLDTLEEWAMKGPYFHVTGKPVKSMKVKWMDKLRESKKISKEAMPANDSLLVTQIKALPEFTPQNNCGSGLKKTTRSQPRNEKILANGIDIEDHEYEACLSYWDDPETYLIALLDNKIACCKERMIIQWTQKFIDDPAVENFPSDVDELIEFIVARPEYKNRVQREAEAEAAREA